MAQPTMPSGVRALTFHQYLRQMDVRNVFEGARSLSLQHTHSGNHRDSEVMGNRGAGGGGGGNSHTPGYPCLQCGVAAASSATR